MEISNNYIFAVLIVFAYLIGAIPWGLILTQKFRSVDIRQAGSGNIGATNVMRIAGTSLGLLTLIGDMLKGILPVWMALIITDPNQSWRELYVAIIILAVFLGHLFPVFLKFRGGGKGVATAAGGFLVISPITFIFVVTIFVLVVLWRRYVSLGSLAASAVLPFFILLLTASKLMTGCALVVTILIYYRHRENIRRLIAGNEPIFWKK